MKHWAATLIALLCFFALSAQQRHVTPIDSSEDLRPVTKEELEQLRLDDYYMTEELNLDRLAEYQQRIGNKALDCRVEKLLKVYKL